MFHYFLQFAFENVVWNSNLQSKQKNCASDSQLRDELTSVKYWHLVIEDVSFGKIYPTVGKFDWFVYLNSDFVIYAIIASSDAS